MKEKESTFLNPSIILLENLDFPLDSLYYHYDKVNSEKLDEFKILE